MGICDALRFGGREKGFGPKTSQQRVIIAVRLPSSLLILLHSEIWIERFFFIPAQTLPNPSRRVLFVVVGQGRETFVEGGDDSDLDRTNVIIRMNAGEQPEGPSCAVCWANFANGKVGIRIADTETVEKHDVHGIIPCRFRPAPPARVVVGDDFIARTGRAQPRVTVLPARPPGMSRRDLIGMNCRLRMTAARRRAVLVVAGTRSRSSNAAVLMASLPRTASS